MDDEEFLKGIERRIEASVGAPVRVELDHDDRRGIAVDFSEPPRIVMGADVLTYPGLARTFIQYAIICLREGRTVDRQEFQVFLSRN